MTIVSSILGIAGLLAGAAFAQTRTINTVQHLNFNTPEAWALKYFTSASMLSGLQPPDTEVELRRFGSLTIGLEMDWIPALSPARAHVGFSGSKQEDLNKAPILARPNIRAGLPWRFSLVAAGTPPFEVFGVRPRLYAFGLERPILEGESWRLGWRGSGQLGAVHSAFTCPAKVLDFAPGSPQNPSGCIAQSDDTASLHYVGTELQFSHRVPAIPRLTPHFGAGINYIDSKFQVNAPRRTARDQTVLMTHGKTFTASGGVSYLLTKRAALTIDAFYTPLWIRRTPGGGAVIDGLFNVRALVSYSLR